MIEVSIHEYFFFTFAFFLIRTAFVRLLFLLYQMQISLSLSPLLPPLPSCVYGVCCGIVLCVVSNPHRFTPAIRSLALCLPPPPLHRKAYAAPPPALQAVAAALPPPPPLPPLLLPLLLVVQAVVVGAAHERAMQRLK